MHGKLEAKGFVSDAAFGSVLVVAWAWYVPSCWKAKCSGDAVVVIFWNGREEEVIGCLLGLCKPILLGNLEDGADVVGFGLVAGRRIRFRGGSSWLGGQNGLTYRYQRVDSICISRAYRMIYKINRKLVFWSRDHFTIGR